jgi:hypothetical protein
MHGQSKSRKSRKVIMQTNNQLKYGCLPSGIKLDTIVSITRKPSESGDQIERETVKQRLDNLNSRCKAGKLVDGKNREIRFYELQGCWGNPPSNYEEILNNQRKELLELKKKYTVIELTCNPSGEMPF